MNLSTPPPPGLWARIKASGRRSFGEIVFGMEDGTVSIFGLVFGLAMTAHSADQVLLAGATGAIAAAVSMAAGVFLDYQSERDQARVRRERRSAQLAADRQAAIDGVVERLGGAGLAPATLAAIRADLHARPAGVLALDGAADVPLESRRTLVEHSAWMFVTDLAAGLIPVAPFAFLPIDAARIVSVLVTLGLLATLGVGRARIGERAVLPTVLQTVAVAGAAAGAGVVIARMLS